MPPKKGGKKTKTDDWDDEAAEKRIAALAVSEPKDDWEEEAPKAKPKPKAAAKNKMAAFAMLMEDSGPKEEEEEEKEQSEEEPDLVVVEESKKKKEKKKGKKDKKGKAAEDDEDIDAILASIESKETKVAPKKESAPAPKEESAPAPKEESPEAKEETPEAADEEKKKKKKKKNKKKDGEAEEEEKEEEKEEEEEEGSDAEGEDKDKKKKKKKKDKKKENKEEKPKKKRQIDLIKEMLKKQQELKEEEEKRIKEEEERFEQLEKEREEKEKAIREQKEKEKEEKRLLIEKQKAAGTYQTAAQKKQQREALEKLKARGISIPVPVDRIPEDEQAKGKTFVHLDAKALRKLEEKKKRKAERQGLATQDTPKETTPEEESKPLPVEAKVSTSEPTPEDDDELDDWEMAVEEKPPVVAAAVQVAQPKQPVLAETKSKEESEDESDEDEESSEEESEEESSSDEETTVKGRETKEQILEKVKLRIKKRKEEAEKKRSTDNLRSPVICVLGHVDTGKTKMLDTIRRTNVQQGEAGGITQQIGATEVPGDAIKERCRQVKDFKADEMKIPGFLIIDTPGHESFSNLRTRGQSLCDFAILVVDIMHGLEQQTIESLKLLLKGKTPFVVALNKVDRLYEYESNPRKDIYEHLKTQSTRVKQEFEERYNSIFAQFAEQGVNIMLSNKNKNTDEYISVIPTSAYLGDGIGNVLSYIVGQTQTVHAKKLAFSEELDATVMEVKSIPGLGTTIDVILVNGTIKAGDVIVLTGTDGAIVTQVRELLMPKPLRELRVKNEYVHYKEVSGARGVKILAKNLEKTLAGLPMYVTDKFDEVDYLKMEAEAQLSNALHDIKKKPEGVYVQASTLGSLEALLEFLKSQKIPYSNVNIGPVHKRDVQKAAAMKEHKIEYACILAFDVKVERDAQIFADHEGVKVFQADIIYHLQDSFLKYREELRERARKEHEHLAIFPCRLRVMPNHVFNARNPIVCGVSIEAGQIKKGTPICVPTKENVFLGTISSIERNNEEVASAKQGEEVCIKIENTTGEAPRLYGRHFTHEDPLVSRITRESIDVCKTYFRDDLSRADWQLIVALKKQLDIF